MKIGIIGLPQSGKTTVFSALSGRNTKIDDYSVKRKELRFGNIKVPDKRIDKIAQIISPKKIIRSEITFVDETESSRDTYKCFSSSHIKEIDALVDVIRLFTDETVLHPLGNIDAVRDLEQLETEVILADLEVIQKRIDKIEKELKGGKKEYEREYALLKKCKDSLEKEKPLRNLEFNQKDENILSGFGFLSKKPLMILANVDEDRINLPLAEDFQKITDEKKLTAIKFCAKIEAEILELNDDEQRQFLEELNIGNSARSKFIKAAYSILDLVSFFTTKNDILKSWTIPRETKAKDAAGKIHSDIERGFIKAEVINYEDFSKFGSFSECRKNNALRFEGKDYIVKDGDMIDFRFNV